MAPDPEANGETGPNMEVSAGEFEALDFRALDAQYTPISPFNEWVTVPVDNVIWERQTGYLNESRAASSAEVFEEALEVAMRAAALETGAIEGLYETDRGFTISVANQDVGWESLMQTKGSQIQEFFEAHLRALDLAAEEAAAKRPVTEVWIRELHEVLTEPQDEYDALTSQGWIRKPLPKGVYKDQPNHVKQPDGSIHAYAPVTSTPSEMSVLVEQLNSGDFATAHPVLQASYAHYAFVAIHPFVDGNGRVARVLASIFLQRTGMVPLLIWKFQEKQYFQALAAADAGSKQEFVNFIFDRSVDAISFVANRLGSRPEEELEDLANLYVSYGGMTFEELDQMATNITNAATTAIQSLYGKLDKPKWVSITVSGSGGSPQMEEATYRYPVGGALVWRLRLQSTRPANATADISFYVLIAKEENARYAFRLESSSQAVAPLDIRLSDVGRQLSPTLMAQMENWAERVLAENLRELAQRAQEARRNAGL